MRFGPHLSLRCGPFHVRRRPCRVTVEPDARGSRRVGCAGPPWRRARGAAVAPVICRAYGSFAGTLAWQGVAGYDAYLETTGGTMHIALDKL